MQVLHRSYWRSKRLQVILEVGLKSCLQFCAAQPILGIRSSDGEIETSDYKSAKILNEHFSTVGEKLENDLPVCSQESSNIYFYRVTLCITNISISYDNVANNIKKMKTNKPADRIMFPQNCLNAQERSWSHHYYLFITKVLHEIQCLPRGKTLSSLPSSTKTLKLTNKTIDKISLLCVPGKLIEQAVATTMTAHIS